MISDWKKGIRILRHTYLKGYDMAVGVVWVIMRLHQKESCSVWIYLIGLWQYQDYFGILYMF